MYVCACVLVESGRAHIQVNIPAMNDCSYTFYALAESWMLGGHGITMHAESVRELRMWR